MRFVRNKLHDVLSTYQISENHGHKLLCSTSHKLLCRMVLRKYLFSPSTVVCIKCGTSSPLGHEFGNGDGINNANGDDSGDHNHNGDNTGERCSDSGGRGDGVGSGGGGGG